MRKKIKKAVTLLDIIIVSKALLLELIATLSVVAWRRTSIVCNTE